MMPKDHFDTCLLGSVWGVRCNSCGLISIALNMNHLVPVLSQRQVALIPNYSKFCSGDYYFLFYSRLLLRAFIFAVLLFTSLVGLWSATISLKIVPYEMKKMLELWILCILWLYTLDKIVEIWTNHIKYSG